MFLSAVLLKTLDLFAWTELLPYHSIILSITCVVLLNLTVLLPSSIYVFLFFFFSALLLHFA